MISENTPIRPKTRKFTPKVIRKVILSLVAIFVVFVVGYTAGNKNYQINYKKGTKVTITRQLPRGRENLDFALFWQVWDTLDEKYYDKDKLVPSKMVYGAIQGMVASIGDPYTAFFTPDQNKVIREDLNGSFDGVGIQIGFRENQLAVVAPLEGSPAAKVGIKAGDLIIGLKDAAQNVDTDTAGLSLQQAVQIIRGAKGTTVTLTVAREGVDKPLVFDIKRDIIDVPTLTLNFVGENKDIADIKLSRFGAETPSEWEQIVIDVLKKQGVKGIILDLRNNPGGYLLGAQDLGSEFLNIGDTVVIEESGDKSQNEYKVERIGRFKSFKTVVLVNGGSASASEILSGALRDNLGVPLIGETTFGKGTIQEPQELEGGEGFHITIAKWLTPNGTWVNEVGIKPDYEVKDNPDTTEDEQLQKAIEVLNNL